jgi:hemerythrin HHE cation binding domain-containing protein
MSQPTGANAVAMPRTQASGPRLDARTPFAELESQHAYLRGCLADLRAMVLGIDPRTDDEVRLKIESARGSLALHFTFEENVGSMHYLLAAWPGLEPELAHLRAEHVDFLATLDRAAAALRDGAAQTDVANPVLLVLDRLIDHELDERQLLRLTLRFGDSGTWRKQTVGTRDLP